MNINPVEENDLLSQPPAYKLNKENAAFIAAFIGGPLGGGYLIAENFKLLGQPEKVKITWLITIGATILIFGGVLYIPALEKIPRLIIPLAYSYATLVLTKTYQGQDIKTHAATGGVYYSMWRAALVGLIGLVVVAAAMVALLATGLVPVRE